MTWKMKEFRQAGKVVGNGWYTVGVKLGCLF